QLSGRAGKALMASGRLKGDDGVGWRELGAQTLHRPTLPVGPFKDNAVKMGRARTDRGPPGGLRSKRVIWRNAIGMRVSIVRIAFQGHARKAAGTHFAQQVDQLECGFGVADAFGPDV